MKLQVKHFNSMLTGIFLLVFSTAMTSQSTEVFEIEADRVESIPDSEIRIFYDKFNTWIEALQNRSELVYPPKENRVNNFVIFTETGIIMKDLKFYTDESCKKSILNSLPHLNSNSTSNAWMYVSLESHVNRDQLSSILNFLREHKIEYYFTTEDKLEEIIEQN